MERYFARHMWNRYGIRYKTDTSSLKKKTVDTIQEEEAVGGPLRLINGLPRLSRRRRIKGEANAECSIDPVPVEKRVKLTCDGV